MSLNLTDRCRIALGLAILHTERSTLPNGEPWIWETARPNGKGKSATHYAKDASGEAALGAEDHYMKVRLVPSIVRPGIRHNSAHRITVCCDQCGSWVPSGRYLQHVGSAKCRKIGDAIAYIESRHVETMAQVASMTPTEYEINLEIGESFRATFDSPAYLVSVMCALEGTRDVETIDLHVGAMGADWAMYDGIADHDEFQRWGNARRSSNMPASQVRARLPL